MLLRLLEEEQQPSVTLPLWVSPVSVRAVYEELSGTLTAIDEQEDLRWWRSRHGPGMPTDWPHFQVGLRHPDPRRQSSGLSLISFSVKEWKPEKKSKKGKKVVEKKGTIEKR